MPNATSVFVLDTMNPSHFLLDIHSRNKDVRRVKHKNGTNSQTNDIQGKRENSPPSLFDRRDSVVKFLNRIN